MRQAALVAVAVARRQMTTVHIELPDELAEQAQAAGLFEPARIADVVKEALRRAAVDRFFAAAAQMEPTDAEEELLMEVIDDEVHAVRAERRARLILAAHGVLKHAQDVSNAGSG